jgi:tetratricopeptide (TPR) repeat protein
MRWLGACSFLFSLGVAAAAEPVDLSVCTGKNFSARERIASCTALIDAGSTRADVYLFRGGAFATVPDFDRAFADYSAAIKLNGGYAQAFAGRGHVQIKRLKYDLAISDYSEALAIRPDADDYHNRGYAFMKRGDFRSAIADYTSALELQPKSATLLNSRCWARAAAGVELAEALADCDRSLAQRESALTRDSRAFVYYRLARYADAVGEYDRVLKADPKNAAALYMRGVAKMQAGLADVDAAAGLDPGVAEDFERYRVKLP